jgi:hypothetical protein
LKKLPALQIEFRNNIYLSPISLEDANILLSRPRVNDADKSQPQIATGLRQTDAQVSGAGFDDYSLRSNYSCFNRLFENIQRRSVFCAAAWIESFQFGEKAKSALPEHSAQPD